MGRGGGASNSPSLLLLHTNPCYGMNEAFGTRKDERLLRAMWPSPIFSASVPASVSCGERSCASYTKTHACTCSVPLLLESQQATQREAKQLIRDTSDKSFHAGRQQRPAKPKARSKTEASTLQQRKPITQVKTHRNPSESSYKNRENR